MTLEQDTIRELLAAVPLFAEDDEAALGAVLSQSQVIEPDKNETLFIQGQEAASLYVVLSGWVKLFRETGDGKEAIAGLCTHGDLFGEAVLYRHATYPFGAQAVSDSIILRIPASLVRERIKTDGEFAARLLEAVGQRLNALELHMEHLTVMSAPQRVGCFLLKLCKGMGKKDVRIMLPYDKTLMATYLGMKLETFSRTLAQLREVGVNVNREQIVIEDVGRLQEYVCGSCSFDAGSCHGDAPDSE